MLYAVSSPGTLKFWPWVNQVCHIPPRAARIKNVSHTHESDASDGFLHVAPRGRHATISTHGVCARHVFASFEGISHRVSISPRVILVEDFGTLAGLTTVKDVLHLEPHGQLNSPMIAWSNRGALDGALEELWRWLADVRSSANAWYSRVVSRRLR